MVTIVKVHLKKSRAVSADEVAQMAKSCLLGDGSEPRVMEAIIGRQN